MQLSPTNLYNSNTLPIPLQFFCFKLSNKWSAISVHQIVLEFKKFIFIFCQSADSEAGAILFLKIYKYFILPYSEAANPSTITVFWCGLSIFHKIVNLTTEMRTELMQASHCLHLQASYSQCLGTICFILQLY